MPSFRKRIILLVLLATFTLSYTVFFASHTAKLNEPVIESKTSLDSSINESKIIEKNSREKQTLPNIIIVGPQKTGTSAFSFFLNQHPDFSTNKELVDPAYFKDKSKPCRVEGGFKCTYEEIQFFNDDEKYNKAGLEWYSSWFQGLTTKYVFEKSANYFNAGVKTVERVYETIPDAIIVVIITDPGKRAYSWYQHQKAHGDKVASEYSFYDVISSDSKVTASLRSECLDRGRYRHFIDIWESRGDGKIVIVDGEEFKRNPGMVLNNFVLQIDEIKNRMKNSKKHDSVVENFDFTSVLKFEDGKSMFCISKDFSRKHGLKKRCLGSGKGRKYPPLDDRATEYLQKFYAEKEDNLKLKIYLDEHGVEIPEWLK